jgi:hypothetical protein
MNCRDALATLLDQVDYTAGNCRPNEMVGAVLPKEIVTLARGAIAEFDHFFKLGMETVDKLIEEGEGNLTTRAADLLVLDALPLNEHLPDESGGAFFVHWSCSGCLPDDFDSSDRCHHCGKPRTAKVESR